MAEFVKAPGSPGTWSAEAATLTVTLGEMAQLLLVGGGPPGQEKLVLGYDGVVTTKALQEFPWDVPDQRLFCITPQKAGDGRIVAHLPVGGGAYTRTIQIIVLPRKASSLGAESVILFTQSLKDDEEHDELGGVYRKAVQGSPEGLVVVLQSYPEFVKFLTTFRDTGRRIGKLEVFSHGSPGAAWLVNDKLDAAALRALRGKGYHTVFAPGARVFFGGCNIAEGVAGVTFLKEFGQTFLFNGGGSVGASTSTGHGIGRHLGTGKNYHIWGETVRLYFDTAGKVEKTEGIDDPARLSVANN
jgi:hypothetical protein